MTNAQTLLPLNDGRVLAIQTGDDRGTTWVNLTFIKLFSDEREPKIKIVSMRLDEFELLRHVVLPEPATLEEKEWK